MFGISPSSPECVWSTRRCLVASALALAILASPAAAGGAKTLLDACFPSDRLKARAGEKPPVKGIHDFDVPEPERALAPFRPVAADLRGAIRRVSIPGGRKLVALTLDLCEQPGEVAGYDGEIIDYLRANNVKATLFAGGKWMRSHAERTHQLMADPLFEIGNHSEAHRNLRLIAGEALGNEIAGPQRAYEAQRAKFAATQCTNAHAGEIAKIPTRIGLFRFPFGACNPAAMAAVNDAGLLAIQWDLSTGDPSPGQSAAQIAEAMVHHSKSGSIIIAHANGRGYHTAEALPLAIPKLKAMGFEFVTVSELLSAGKPEIAQSCFDSRPGDTDKYDTFFSKKKAAPDPAVSGK